MIRADLDRRIDEIGLALSETFESEGASLVRKYDAGKTYFIQLSWVVKSRRYNTRFTMYCNC